MKYTADLRSLTFIFIAWFYQLGVIFFIVPHANIPLMILLFCVNLLFVFQVALINHNHRHLNIFTTDLPNEIMNHIISFIILSPSTRLHAVHILNHHTQYKDQNDWAGYKLIPARYFGISRALIFLKLSSLMMFKNRRTLSLSVQLRRQQTSERIAVSIYLVALIFLKPVAVFIWLLPSCILGLYFLLFANLANHDECELESDLNHSRNFTAKLENWIFCNNGYHTAHHLKPSLHWSKYPELHEEQVAHQIDPRFNEKSLFLFSLKNYILPTFRSIQNSQLLMNAKD